MKSLLPYDFRDYAKTIEALSNAPVHNLKQSVGIKTLMLVIMSYIFMLNYHVHVVRRQINANHMSLTYFCNLRSR